MKVRERGSSGRLLGHYVVVRQPQRRHEPAGGELATERVGELGHRRRGRPGVTAGGLHGPRGQWRKEQQVQPLPGAVVEDAGVSSRRQPRRASSDNATPSAPTSARA